MNSRPSKRIIVAPLDWGLGHATRCVPMIEALRSRGHVVILVADGRPYNFLGKRFPEIELIRCAGYDITYPENGHLLFHLAKKSYDFYRALEREEKDAAQIAKETQADVIISDNRLCFRSDNTTNIYITHQVNIKAGIASSVATLMHQHYYKAFDQIWIPDNKGSSNISGELGHAESGKMPMHYSGPQTRFSLLPDSGIAPHGKLLVTLSGPEPQRTLFEKKILEELKRTQVPAIVLQGKPDAMELCNPLPNVEMISHADDETFFKLISGAEIILTRPGYSTLCDLATMNKKIIAVPTPGQTEQEYLAEFHAKRNQMVAVSQREFELESALGAAEKIQPFNIAPEDNLGNLIDRFV